MIKRKKRAVMMMMMMKGEKRTRNNMTVEDNKISITSPLLESSLVESRPLLLSLRLGASLAQQLSESDESDESDES